MTYKEISTMIRNIGLPYTYNSFPNNIAPKPPYIVFNYPDRDDFGADDVNYVGIETLNLELYSANKDFDTEDTIETVLNQNGLFFDKSEVFIRNENLYQITYTSQFIVNKE